MNTIHTARGHVQTIATTLSSDPIETALLAAGTAYIAGVQPATTVLPLDVHTFLVTTALIGTMIRHGAVASKRSPWGPDSFAERVTDLAAIALYTLAGVFIASPYVPLFAL